MSYSKMMKWNKKHVKGIKPSIIMHTGSGFSPSISFINRWIKYTSECVNAGINVMDCETYYKSLIR